MWLMFILGISCGIGIAGLIDVIIVSHQVHDGIKYGATVVLFICFAWLVSSTNQKLTKKRKGILGLALFLIYFCVLVSTEMYEYYFLLAE